MNTRKQKHKLIASVIRQHAPENYFLPVPILCSAEAWHRVLHWHTTFALELSLMARQIFLIESIKWTLMHTPNNGHLRCVAHVIMRQVSSLHRARPDASISSIPFNGHHFWCRFTSINNLTFYYFVSYSHLRHTQKPKQTSLGQNIFIEDHFFFIWIHS